ncbi:MAG: ABC transporter ATP-binding protein [Spirochaetaceae bacterium]|jgi:ABC-2 type transport system ATP-binding protein|nr:ABC transporter ATP-binding protein [Spirochaetaceae bacterium]
MLEAVNLVKTFGGFTAVDEVSFTIPDGAILGLIGQNGAGKTTIFRLILGLMRPDRGSILWNGSPASGDMRNRIGYLPEERGLYPKETIERQILYFARLRGKRKADIAPKIGEWLDAFKVSGKKTDKVQTLSKGNQQKVQLIIALIHEPDLVILDEPFSGLDPINAGLLKKSITDLKRKGSSVIFSSHTMEHIERICDSVVMLKRGKTVLAGTVPEIRRCFGRTKLFLESSLTAEEIAEIEGVQSVTRRNAGLLEIALTDPDAGKRIFKLASRDGYIPVFNQQPPSLEEIFKLKAEDSF